VTHAPQLAAGCSETRNKGRPIPYLGYRRQRQSSGRRRLRDEPRLERGAHPRLHCQGGARWCRERPATQPASLEMIRASEARIKLLNRDCQEFMLCFALSIARRNGPHG